MAVLAERFKNREVATIALCAFCETAATHLTRGWFPCEFPNREFDQHLLWHGSDKDSEGCADCDKRWAESEYEYPIDNETWSLFAVYNGD